MENDGMLPDDKPVHIGRGRYPEPAYTAPVAPIVTREEESEITHLREYWKVILARRYSILAIAATVVLFVQISTMRETPIYRATAVVQIDKENAKVLAFDSLYELQAGEDDELQTQFKILASRTLARRVVEDLHLNKRGEMTPAAPGMYDLAKMRAHQIARDILHTLISPKIDSASTPPSNEPDELRPYVDGYLGGLRVSPVTRTRLANISFESADRRLAAQIVNAHAEHFISQNLESRYDATQVASEFLNTELQQMKSKLEKAEDALQAYSRDHQIIFLEGGDGKNQEGKSTETQKLADLEANYTKAQGDRIEKESFARLTRNQGGAADPSQTTLNSTFAAKLIDLRREDSDLAVTFTPDYPRRQRLRSQIEEIEKAVKDERAQAISRAEGEYAAALDRERLIRQEVEKQKDIVNKENQEAVQYNILKRDATSNRQLYDVLSTRLKEAGISSGLKPSNIRIVDRAEVPSSPIRPDKTQNFMWSVVIGLTLGLGFAFFQEYMDNSIKTPEDVTKYLHLPTLAIIPRLQSVGKKGRYGYNYIYAYAARKKREAKANEPPKPIMLELVTQHEPSTVLSESYRSLRASMILSAPDRPPRSILISSAVPSEGKTATTTNLAITLTQIGSKVLIVDADMRKPRAGAIFSLKQKPGLSHFLTGTEPLKAVIHPCDIPNLYVMPCGAIPPNPSELLLSTRFRHMMKTLQGYFDYIVIDSPPLNNVSDGRIIATCVEGVVFVTKAMATSRYLALRALEHLEEGKAHMLGVVLNDYDLQRMSSYYYLYYSGRYHSYYSYYSSSDGTKKVSKSA